MINRAIFVESTLSQREIQPFLRDSDLILPSIKRGQLIQLYRNYPFIQEIVIVDGVFEQCPSITHKEILWMLSQKVNVIGIASMGALRAYELRNHGMIGYGWVYEQYLSGHIDGDDEVAVAYNGLDPSNTKTLAMVNFRKTFRDNLDNHILGLIKSIHFKERTWQGLSKYISPSKINKMQKTYVDAKKEDVLQYMKCSRISPENVCVYFTPNVFFKKMRVTHSKLLTEYLINKIDEVYVQDNNTPIQIRDDYLYICNFLLLPIECLPKVASLLEDVAGIECSPNKIKKFTLMLQGEFKIYCQQDLLYLLAKRRVPIKYAYNLFHNLTKLFDILL